MTKTDTIAASNGSILSYPIEPIHFKTFPDPRMHQGSNFRFLVTSCIKPNFPYAPLHGNRIKGFDLLADYLWPQVQETVSAANDNSTEEASPEISANETFVIQEPVVPTPDAEFMLFLGDFVYADVPFYFGDDKEAYRRLYRRNYQSRSFRKVYERLRTYFYCFYRLMPQLSF
jgi:alkaline phosphatase D